MKTIYFYDENGNKKYVDVEDKVAEVYESYRRAEWRNNAYERYHSYSLDLLFEGGYEFAAEGFNIEKDYIDKSDKVMHQKMLFKLKKILPLLTELQKKNHT